MKLDSNVGFRSNVYVIGKIGQINKLSNEEFRTHVLDSDALGSMYKMGMKLSEIQKQILEHSTPCVYANKKCTFGVVWENSEPVFINICDNYRCRCYSECSSKETYRKFNHPDDITPPTTISANDTIIELTGSVHSHTQGTKLDSKKVIKVHQPPLRSKTIPYTTYIDVYTPQWNVRGFYRRNADGSLSWVKPHVRRRQNLNHDRYATVLVPERYSFSNQSMCGKFMNLYKESVARLENKKRVRNTYIEQQNSLHQNEEYYRLRKVRQISGPDEIINSAIDARILVNSGPGTGKTYTVIERLKYIVKNDLLSPDDVLVLCFSRNAVKVIRDRLSDAIKNNEIPYSAERLQICTFDSFATWYLMQVEPNLNLSVNSYDDRIRMFIDRFNRDSSILNDALKYLIVDEMQDIVGVRARLIKTLLSKIDCGFMLLGDLCQAIFDYTIETSDTGREEDKLNASKLYSWLENDSPFRNVLQEYEITSNRRSDEYTAKLFALLRDVMLHKDFEEQKETLDNVIASFRRLRDTTCPDNSGKTEAFLSWSNSDAFKKSQELYSEGKNHELRAGNRRLAYRRELADILCCYDSPKITKQRFMNTGIQKSVCQDTLSEIWNGLLYAVDADDDCDLIDVAKLRKGLLMEKKVKECLLLQSSSSKTVSTIHKAKGSEYDYVHLMLSDNITTPDDIKVYYVALTRARCGVDIKTENTYSGYLRTSSNRFLKLRKGKLNFIELGLDDDIDPIGFVSTELGDEISSVEERQNYISENIHSGDPITIRKSGGNYLIVHGGHIVGCLDSKIFDSIWYYNRWGRPHKCNFEDVSTFTQLYVRDVVTIVNKKQDLRIDENYMDSGFWYGIEFCGIAKVNGQ